MVRSYMKRLLKLFIHFFLSCVPILSFSQINYLGQEPPGSEPEIFAEDIISVSGRNDRVLSFDPLGRDLFFTVAAWPNSKIYYMRYDSSSWSVPEVASFCVNNGCTEPFFAPDGDTLYYSSNRNNTSTNYELWKVSRSDSGWSEPTNLGDIINSTGDRYHPSIVDNRKLYFASYPSGHADIFFSTIENGNYTIPKNIGSPINTRYDDWDPYLPLDENYMIFKSNRPGGEGGFDGYISFKNEDSTWSNPINLGPTINTISNDDVGDVSPDGKYLFFSRYSDIYWVSTSIIDSLRQNVITNNERDTSFPTSYDLLQNYPNPFNPVTKIQFIIPENAFIMLDVFSVSGKRVATLVNEEKNGGLHEVVFDASNLSSGLYFYSIHSKNFMKTKMMILVK